MGIEYIFATYNAVKKSGFGVTQTWAQILELSCNNCGTSGKLPTADLYLLHLYNGRGE